MSNLTPRVSRASACLLTASLTLVLVLVVGVLDCNEALGIELISSQECRPASDARIRFIFIKDIAESMRLSIPPTSSYLESELFCLLLGQTMSMPEFITAGEVLDVGRSCRPWGNRGQVLEPQSDTDLHNMGSCSTNVNHCELDDIVANRNSSNDHFGAMGRNKFLSRENNANERSIGSTPIRQDLVSYSQQSQPNNNHAYSANASLSPSRPIHISPPLRLLGGLIFIGIGLRFTTKGYRGRRWWMVLGLGFVFVGVALWLNPEGW